MVSTRYASKIALSDLYKVGFMYLAREMGNIGTLDLVKEGMRTIQTKITFNLSCRSTTGTSHLSLQRCTPQAQ